MKNREEFDDLIKKIEDRSFNKATLNIDIDVLNEDRVETELTAEQIILLAAALKTNPTITYLSLYGNKIDDDSAIVLASISTLKKLDLSYNDITHIGAMALAKCPLERLNLSENNIYYKEEYNTQFKEMIEDFGNNKTIKKLMLFRNTIPSTMLGELIGKNRSIEELYIGEAQYPFSLTDDVLKFIGQNAVLDTLYLFETEITNKGISYLGQNKSIKKLHIDKSSINDIGVSLLCQYSNLKDLYLKDSDLTFYSAVDLVASNLDFLNIIVNTKQSLISSSDIEIIKSSFYELRQEEQAKLQEDIELQKELEIEEELSTITKMESEENSYAELTNNVIYDSNEILDDEFEERQFKETIQLQEKPEEEILITTKIETLEDSYQESMTNSIIYDSNALKVIGDDSMDTSDFYC